MPAADLCTPDDMIPWIGIKVLQDSLPLALSLASQCSAVIRDYLNRSVLLAHDVTETYSGVGSDRMTLRQWPVVAVSSVAVDGVAIAPSVSFGAAGYVLDAWDGAPPGGLQQLSLRGSCFTRGRQNVTVVYRAGYVVMNESATAAAELTVAMPYGPWCRDEGVTFASSGAALALVTGVPSTGQYALGDSRGQYIFASADVGQAIKISYSFVPFALNQAAMELVAERFRYRERIGMTSQSLGGQETTAYRVTDMPDYVKGALASYRTVAPV